MNKKYKKLFYFTAVIVVACVMASSVITALTAPYHKDERTSVVSPSSVQRVYVLTQRQGKVTAYIRGIEVPYIETTTSVNSLPYDIQERLRVGIEFQSEEELRKVMDEYCS